LRSQGILNVFITLDKDGVCVNTTDYRGIISALPARVNDTKGAGDAFASVVIEELASENKKPILEIVHLGLIASSLVVEITGKTYGMLSKDAIKERSKIYE
jgi:sugar/nucleoside kinase (ribokinase family)